jgi:predicted RNase H-like HicB family nuclease
MRRIELEQEHDGRWIADIAELPGVMANGATREEAQSKVESLALRTLADRI